MYFLKIKQNLKTQRFYYSLIFPICYFCTSLFQSFYSFKSKFMKNSIIKNTGNYTFILFFLLGNTCLFGYLITKNDEFAAAGFTLLQFATPINLFVILCLMIYGLFSKPQLKICMKASLIICINIPIAVLYFYIGLSLLNF